MKNYDTECYRKFPEKMDEFIEIIKPLIVGHPLNHILSRGIIATPNCDKNSFLSQYNNQSIEWKPPLVFIVNGYQLEFFMWQPERYRINFNTVIIGEKINASDFSVYDIQEQMKNAPVTTMLDLSQYFPEIVKSKITDVVMRTRACGDDNFYHETIHIILDNGKRIVVRNHTEGVGLDIEDMSGECEYN